MSCYNWTIFSCYEFWTLVEQGLYDVLTFGLLYFVAYDALVKPKSANLAISFDISPEDTKKSDATREWQPIDFVIDNKGPALENIKISSKPEFLGWEA